MAITKKKTTPRHKTKILTKREKAQKRVAYIKKVIEKKKRIKRDTKKKRVSYKQQMQKEAQNEVIELVQPKLDNEDANQINILDILGLGDNSTSQNIDWQAALQKKLKEVNEKSLDNPEVRRVYSEIGKIFNTYRSGKVPKAFKIIPNLEKWNQVLQMTRPENWTPQAMFQAVNIFASNFDPVRAQEFYKQYLVPSITKDLANNKKLNYHYYESLKKALYKTNAWFKGILFQFCDNSTAMKEIKVIQSLLSKMSIPVISASVAMIKMMEMTPCSAVTHYLQALLKKNYSFPKKVILLLVKYFQSFQNSQQELPVVWHQLLLTLTKQYGSSLDQMQKASICQLTKTQNHKLISPQIVSCLK